VSTATAIADALGITVDGLLRGREGKAPARPARRPA
jgi:hypothetical protein